MKICFLTDAWAPIWGGGQEHIWQLSEIIREKYGCQVDIIAPTLVNPNFNFHNFFHRVSFTFWVLWFLLTSDYDFYHSHSFSTSAFLPIAKLRGKKTAFTVHGIGGNLIGSGWLNGLGIAKLLRNIVLYVWPYDYRFSASYLKGFITAGNGVNVGEYDAVRVKTDPRTFRIVWVGRRFDPVKGVKYLEGAIGRLKDEYPNIDLDIVENVYGQEKIKRIKQADLFVLPSLSEGLPLALLEAMAARLPVIVTDVGDCRTLVEQAKCGLVVTPKSSASLVTAIERIMEVKVAGRNKLGLNGYNFVKKNYSWNRVGRKVASTIGLTMIKSGTK